jgi:hypothetical protein
MAVQSSAVVEIIGQVDAPTPGLGSVLEKISLALRLANGQGSGQADCVYHELHSFAASGTVTLNTLAAGALKDRFNSTVDLDELKILVVVCLTGSIEVVGAASNPMGCFTASSEGVKLTAGQAHILLLGATGLAVTSNSQFTITETTTTLTASAEVMLIGAK